MEPPVQTSRQKIIEFKKKIIWRLCTDLLDPPLPPLDRLRLSSDMSDYDREEARRRHADSVLNREVELRSREPELLSRLEDIMLRVIQSRAEQVIDNSEVWATPKAEQQGLEFECDVCGNKDQKCFLRDGPTGDTICLGSARGGCGNVVQDHRVDEGSQFRTFADDEGKDRNHHGPAPDPLMPDSENMKTSLLGVGAAFKKLNQANQYVEMNLSNIGNDDRRTRTSYRNKHKRDAFQLMEDAAEQMGAHDSVVAKAREEFARFRDVREHVISYHGVVAACLCIAFEELVLSNQLPAAKKRTAGAPLVQSSWAKLPDQAMDAGKAIEAAAAGNPVICTLCERQLKTFTMAELNMWLKAVFCTNNSIDGSEQIRLLQVQLEASLGCTDRPALSATTQAILANARKRVASDGPSWMGSTTIATRAKKSKLNNGGVGNGLSVIAVDPNEIGHTFLRLDLERALTEPTAAALLRSAVKSRLKFEAWAAGKMAERDLEDRRLLQERADFRMQNVQDKTGENKMKKPIAEITIVPTTGEDDMLRAMLSATNTMVDTVEIVAPSLAPTKNSGPKIRMAVVSGECTSSPKKSKIMKVEPAVHSTEYQTDKNEKNSQYFYENGKRMRMVERIRTDGRTGKQIKVVIKEEVPSDWESEEDG